MKKSVSVLLTNVIVILLPLWYIHRRYFILLELQVLEPKKECKRVNDFLKTNRNELCNKKKISTDLKQEHKSKKRKLCDVDFFDSTETSTTKLETKNLIVKSTDNDRGKKVPMLGRGLNKIGTIEFSDNEEDMSYDKYTGEDTQTGSVSLCKPNADNIDKTRKHTTPSNESIRKKVIYLCFLFILVSVSISVLFLVGIVIYDFLRHRVEFMLMIIKLS